VALEQAVQQTISRELSEQMARYHQALAERLGLTLSDHKALDLVCNAGTLTAGQLAEQINLTSGAVTGLIDRLERAGLVRREHDPQDRRRVIVHPCVSGDGGLSALNVPLMDAVAGLCARYSDEELAVIEDFTQQMVTVLQGEVARLQEKT
jgi:DNA-binding MarR family transcriptional regulator